MAGQTPSWNDNGRDLWRKIAANFYEYGLNEGATDLNPPSWNDSIYDLEKKTAYITAKTVDVQP
jgi:hypothetical protein